MSGYQRVLRRNWLQGKVNYRAWYGGHASLGSGKALLHETLANVPMKVPQSPPLLLIRDTTYDVLYLRVNDALRLLCRLRLPQSRFIPYSPIQFPACIVALDVSSGPFFRGISVTMNECVDEHQLRGIRSHLKVYRGTQVYISSPRS